MRSRKIWSILLALAILAALVPAAAKETAGVIADYQFDDQPTLSVPKSCEYKGKWVEIVEQDAYVGKSLRLYSPEGQVYAQFPFTHKSDKIVLDAKFKFVDQNAGRQIFMLKAGDGKLYETLKVSPDGMLSAADDYQIRQLKLGEWVNISVLINLKLSRAEVYIDGRLTATTRLSSAIQTLTGVRFVSGAPGVESEMLLDDLRIYEGGRLLGGENFPQVEKNLRKLEKTEEDYAPDPESNMVYLNENCNDYTQGNEGPWTIINKGNTVSVADVPSAEDKSMVMSVEQQDPYMEVSFSGITSRYLVAETKVRIDDANCERSLFTMKDSGGNFNMVASINNKGEAVTYNGRTLVKMIKKQWYSITVTFDFENMLSNYYVDGKLVQENIAVNNKSLADVAVLRFQCYSPSSKSVMYVDDVRLYDGKEPKSPDELENTEVIVKGAEMFIPEKDVIGRLGNAVAMVVGGRYAFDGAEKVPLSTQPYRTEAGIIMIPLRFTVEACGGSVTWNQAENCAEIILGTQKGRIAPGDTSVTIGGRTAKFDASAEEVGGTLYVQAERFAKVLNKDIYQTERGLIILSGNENKFDLQEDAQDLLYIYNFLYYMRPKAEQFLSDLKKQNPNGEHPRVLLRQEDFDRIRENYDSDETTHIWVEQIRENVEKYVMDAPVTKYEMPDGLRLTGESQKVQSRVMQLALLYRLFGERKYADRAWKELEAAGNFKDWNANRHFLDTGEMAAGFGIGYDWLYDYFTPEQRQFLLNATEKSGFIPTRNAYNGIGGSAYFVNITNNWNIICNSGVAVAALAMADELPDLAGEILERGMESTEYMMCEFFPEGGWYEGVGYWYYQATYLAYYVTALRSALGTDYGFYDIPGFKDTGYYPIFGNGPCGIFDFHDSGNGFQNAPELFFFAKMNRDGDLAKLRLEDMEKHSYAGSVKDLIWYEPELASESVQLPLDKKFAYAEMGAFRSGWDDDATYLGFHAGKNDVSHANVDAGTFVIDAMGERWAIELGGDNYNLEGYFGDKRWDYYRLRAEGQNVLVLNPAAGMGQIITAQTTIEDMVSKPQGAIGVLDLSNAFADSARNVTRAFRMDDNRRRIVMQDEMDLKGPTEVFWNMHTKAEVEIMEDGRTAMLSLGQKKLWMALDTNIPGAKFSVMDAVPLPTSPHPAGQNENKGIRKIVVDEKEVTGKAYLTVTFIPVYDLVNTKLEAATYSPIADWEIPDGVKEIPEATAISVDGNQLKDFNGRKYNYEIRVPVGSESIPKLSAEAPENMQVTIQQAETVPALASVIVTDKNDPENKTVYSVSYVYAPLIGLPEGVRKISPDTITVSDEPQPENNKGNLNDGDLNTRWSAEGIQTATYEFAVPQKVSAVALSFYLGLERTTKFDLEISADGKNWTTVFSGSSSGETDQYETIYFNEAEIKYVRFRGYGNSQHDWTSVNEMTVYGK